jgi:DNA-binding MarR family transcriptional regulator
VSHQPDRRCGQTAEATELPCLGANLRRAARFVSQLFETTAGWSGLRVTQFSVLQAIARTGTITHGALGTLLGLDQTTVSRSLAPLRRRRWVRDKYGKDRRERHVTLTVEGRMEFDRAEKGWQRVQANLRRRYGVPEWDAIQRALTAIANTALTAQGAEPAPDMRSLERLNGRKRTGARRRR